MAAKQSATGLFAQVANQIGGRLSALDIDALDKVEQRALKDLKRLVTDVRLDLRDYEYADTRAELLKHGAAARERLTVLRAAILGASEHGVFGAADVAQLTAQLDAVAFAVQ